MELKENMFTNIQLSFGLVVRGELEDIKELKQIIAASLEKLEIEPIYQRLSPAKLFIREISADSGGGDDGI